MALSHLLVPAVLMSFTACAYQTATFTPDGYHQERYDYDVRYANRAQREIMPAGWVLDNYSRTESGLEPKSGEFYETTFRFDTDKDGGFDAAETVPTFELRFMHRQTGSSVWLRTVPAMAYETKRTVYALGRYADGVATAGYERAQFGEEVAPDARKFAVQILQMRQAELAGKPALALTVEVANLAELKKTLQATRTRVKFVLQRTDNTRGIPTRDYEYETVLVAGYASRPATFLANLPDFDKFLGQIVVKGRSGYRELPLG